MLFSLVEKTVELYHSSAFGKFLEKSRSWEIVNVFCFKIAHEVNDLSIICKTVLIYNFCKLFHTQRLLEWNLIIKKSSLNKWLNDIYKLSMDILKLIFYLVISINNKSQNNWIRLKNLRLGDKWIKNDNFVKHFVLINDLLLLMIALNHKLIRPRKSLIFWKLTICLKQSYVLDVYLIRDICNLTDFLTCFFIVLSKKLIC
jgi:hypothetical protein